MKRAYNILEAYAYLGIKRKAFDKHIRPLLPAPTQLGTTKVWERTDLDAAFEAVKGKKQASPEPQARVEEPPIQRRRGVSILPAAESFEKAAARVLAKRKRAR